MKRTFGIVLVLLAVPATAVWAVAGFSDVPEDHPQAEDIQYAVDQGWFQGYPDGSFTRQDTQHPTGGDSVREGISRRCEPCRPRDDSPCWRGCTKRTDDYYYRYDTAGYVGML